MVRRSSITGVDELAQRAQKLTEVSVPRLIHAGMLSQMRAKRAQIPKSSGALERSILNGSDDKVTDYRVSLEALYYGQYHDLPQIDERRLIDQVGRELFKLAGLSGGF